MTAVAAYPLALSAADRPQTRAAPAVRRARLYFAVLAAASLAAFVLNIENRFTAGGLFSLRVPVDLVPPLDAKAWMYAYVLHQQDPLFAACGGTESIEDYKVLYVWEWLRIGSLMGLAALGAIGLVGAAARPRFRFCLPRLLGLSALLVLCAAAGPAVGAVATNVAALAYYDVGQYRHAADVTFTSAGLAMVLASVVRPPHPDGRRRLAGTAWLWAGAIVLDICFGALFAARDAAKAWPTWPGYESAALPPFDRLVSYSPLWVNFTFNPYMIQLMHRGLSAGLWLAALAGVVTAVRRNAGGTSLAVALFAGMTAQMAAGIATLVLGTPAVIAILHLVGGACVLACALPLRQAPLESMRTPP